MKKILFLTLALLVTAITFTGCVASPAPSNSSVPSEDTPPSESVSEPDSEMETETETQSERLYVADAAMYRGIITGLESNEKGETVLTMEQAKGTDFGAPSLQLRITDDTKFSFDKEKLTAGTQTYYEVFYSIALGKALNPAETQDAIAMNQYFDVNAVNFNGKIKQILSIEGKDGEGRLVMEEMDTEQEMVFNYSPDTQFYLDIAAMKPGDVLNIFHRGIYTMSIPPQGIPLEVRIFAEPAAK